MRRRIGAGFTLPTGPQILSSLELPWESVEETTGPPDFSLGRLQSDKNILSFQMGTHLSQAPLMVPTFIDKKTHIFSLHFSISEIRMCPIR